MKHVGGILTAVALSLSLGVASIEAKGLRLERRDLTPDSVVHDPQQTPFFQLLPQSADEVTQLSNAKKWMKLAGLATFVSVDGQKLSINRYDVIRGIVESSKHWVDKSATGSRVMSHSTLAYNAGVKTPLQYGKGGRAGSSMDGKLSRLAHVNAKEEDYKGPSVATIYAERSPVMLDAKKVGDVESFVTYFAQALADNPALNAVAENRSARPVLLLTVKNNLLLNEVSANAIADLQQWFTVTTLAEEEVNEFFSDAANRVLDLGRSYSKDLNEVAVPLGQGMWSDFSSLFQNFDWKRFMRVTVKDGSKKIIGEALPVLLALYLWNKIKGFGGPSVPSVPAQVEIFVKKLKNFFNKTKVDSLGIHGKINNHKRTAQLSALAALVLNNIVPVINERGGLDKMISWKAVKVLGNRFIRNLYGAEQYEGDTKEKRIARTALNYIALLVLLQTQVA
ncbi:MAG: hypothetical protein PVJ92_01095 [Candidatus Dependentiae bacterium]|jgi:hypothetical protein